MNKKPIPDYGDLMTVEEFVECCKAGGFVDYDGVGLYSDGEYVYGNMYNNGVRPSMVMSGTLDKNYSHVLWFNR